MAQEKMTLEDWLDDLCVRFIINLPRADLSSVARICFQIEEAQWFYEDFIRPLDPTLPSMSLRSFSLKMFTHCPLLASFSADSHLKAFEEFMQYKTRVPVRGAIMLNEAMDAAVLVRGWKKGASWSFPRGKINYDEPDLDCAVREVYEETGYDLRKAGIVERNEPVHPLEATMHDQQVRLYVFRGIPEDTVFATKTRKEIGDIRWYNVSELPAFRKKKGAGKNQGATSQDKFYMVAPFMVPLRQWVMKQKKNNAHNAPAPNDQNPLTLPEETLTDDNVLDEPMEPPLSGTHPEFIDGATRELQRLLQVKPPTQGLQLPSPTTNQQAGQTLMSLLQPKMASNGRAPGHNQEMPRTPLGQELAGAPEPQTPQYHHVAHKLPQPNYAAPPAFPIEPNAHASYLQHQHQQHRARPHVYVTNEINIPQPLPNPPRPLPNPPVQLVHPQPLPLQAQILRGMAPSPAVKAPGAQATPNTGHLQGGQYAGPGPQYQPHAHGVHGIQPEMKQPQLPAHTAGLLSVLKGHNPQPNSGPQSAQQPSPLHGTMNISMQQQHPQTAQQPSPLHRTMNISMEHQHPQRPSPASNGGYAGQYGQTSMPPTTVAQASFSAANVRLLAPTDKHRAGLLGMFKPAESTSSQGHAGSEDKALLQPQPATAPTVRQPAQTEQLKQQRVNQGPILADTLRTAAQENGRPMQMNPETNLPFGAHAILARPQAGQASAAGPKIPGRNLNEPTRSLPLRSQASSTSSTNKLTPQPAQVMMKVQHVGQASPPAAQPLSAQSYPYGSTEGLAPNPLALFPNPPAASSLPMPGTGFKARQGSTVEQRSTLLSLFGKSNSGVEQDKGKEAMTREQFGGGAAPRTRLASFASSVGDGAVDSNGPRRDSPSALSPADRNFLLGFLENASNNAGKR
ncbi:Uu.00g001840.m01.CDS01 [Anthostomella pinea]|uniref:Uu.00g001840.m01.CDS01 n=1 Tax=Anthostomella pinea TaxID=933095 RepID=A0AAI8VKK8_9PEZI|nr:Uu.00g001840.m01.CDS01 [Anthostomella pinea]